MIDKDHLEMLKSILDKEKFGALLDLYCKDSGRLIQECKDALEKSQWQHLAESAHALKGSSANVGIKGIAELAKELEVSAKANDKALCVESLSAIGAKQVDVVAALAAFK